MEYSYAIANVFSMGVGFATQYSALPMYRSMNGWVFILFAAVSVGFLHRGFWRPYHRTG